jgi:GT2 family glycosyltransferase
MSWNRADSLGEVLDRLLDLAIDQAVVADNASEDGTPEVVACRIEQWAAAGRELVLLRFDENIGVAARNRAIERATGEYLLFIDDDSYPLPGSLERMADAMAMSPRTAIVGAFVVEIDGQKQVVNDTAPGSFDWMLRAGAKGEPPPDGFPTYFFPEGASLARRAAIEAVGGYYEPFFFTIEGFELCSRLFAGGWDVRYLPTAPFHHMKPAKPHAAVADMLRLGARNQIWYFWMRFPAALAARRIVAYALYDLLVALSRKAARSWAAGVVDAWRLREQVRGDRAVLPRDVVRRAEMRRGRDHVRFVLIMGRRWLTRSRPTP